MTPTDPNEPLPTTAAGGRGSAQPGGSGPAYGGAPGWPPPYFAPPPPPRRDRVALAVVAFVFGGIFLAFFGFLFLAWSAVRGSTPHLGSGPRVGVVAIRGGIGLGDGGPDAERVLKQLRRFADDDDLKAVVVRIDSPGGAVGPSQEIHDEVARLARKKTVVCSLGAVAASGGYYVAVGCPRIVAAPGTLTGSIGVISQFPNVRRLAERLDVRMETVKSGKLKDAGNPFRDMTPDERGYWQDLVDRTHRQFVAAVARGRKLDEARVWKIADGRVLNGEDAKALGLVDALGNFYDAVDLAKREANLEGEPVLVYPPDAGGSLVDRLLGSAAGAVADAVGARLAREAGALPAPGLYFLAR